MEILIDKFKIIYSKIFRYKITTTAFLICFTCAFISLYYGITILKNIYYEYNAKLNYKYSYETSFSITPENDDFINDLEQAIKNEKCNLKIIEVFAYLDDLNQTSLIDICVKSYSENYPVVEGRLINKSEIKNKENVVLLGVSRKDGVYKKNGEDYFRILGDEYKVIGYLSSEKDVTFDYSIIVYGPCLGEGLNKFIIQNKENGLEMILQSNVNNTDAIYYNTISNIDNINPVKNINEVYTASAVPSIDIQVICAVIYIFSFICISIILYLWIQQRKREMVIRKIYGYTNSMVINLISKELLIQIILSFIISFFIILISNSFLENMVRMYKLNITKEVIIPIFLMLLVSVVIISLKPIYQIMKIEPHSILNSRR